MAVEKPIGEPNLDIEVEGVEIETPNMEIEAVEMQEDGSAIVNPGLALPPELAFDSNLADYVDEKELGVLSSDLLGDYENDKSSRKDWYESYRKGLDLLGFRYQERTQPFQGASGVTHPLLAESVTQFQAQAYKELLPAGGPVRTHII